MARHEETSKLNKNNLGKEPNRKMDEVCLAGDWLREDTLGRGIISIVTLWRNRNTKQALALKYQRNNIIKHHQQVWKAEANLMKNIDHRNIVKAIVMPEEMAEALKEQITVSLCTEYCSGGDLRRRLNIAEHCTGLDEAEIRTILAHIGSAIEHLHSLAIVHRNIKPENIVLSHPPGNKFLQYKLTDLGQISQTSAVISGGNTISNLTVSVQYFPPEVLRGLQYSQSADYWSLGVVTAELVNGIRPFPFDTSLPMLLNLIDSKSFNEICGEVTLHGDLKLHERLFEESRCSEPFRLGVSEWLRSALNTDAICRGRKNIDEEVTIFKDLYSLVNTVVLNIFWLNELSLLTYRVDQFTRWSTLCSWLERDTSIKKHSLTLITTTGEILCGEPKNGNELLAIEVPKMLFLISLDRIEEEATKKLPKIGGLLRRCMEKPKTELKGNDVQKLCRQLFNLAYTQKDMEIQSVSARRARLTFIKSDINKLQAARDKCDKTFAVLEEIQSFISSAINADEERMKGHQTDKKFTDKYSNWLKATNNTLGDIIKLKEAQDAFDARLSSAQRRIEEIPEVSDSIEESECVQKACASVLAARRLNKTVPATRETRQAVQLAYECLKKRELLLNDGNIRRSSITCIGLCQENSKMHKVITQLSAEAQRLLNNLKKAAESRDDILWSNIKPSSSPISFKIGGAVRHDRPSLQTIPDLSSLLSDSITLRETSRKLIEDYQTKQKSICQEINQFNFS